MNFTFPTTIPGAGTTTTTSDANTSGMPNFSFGSATVGAGDANKPLGTGFSLTSTSQNKPSGLFTTGGNVGQTGFTFGTTPTTSAQGIGTITSTAAPTLSFDVQTPNTSVNTANVPAASGFNLSASTIVSTPGYSFGTIKPTVTPIITTNNVATTTATSTINTGFGIKSAKPLQTPAQIPTTTTTKLHTTQSGPASTWGSYTASSGFTTQGITPTTVTSTGFSLGSQTTTSSTTTTASTGFTLGKTTASIAPTTSATPSVTQTSLGTTTTVSSSTGGGDPSAMNFCQLEESINKWTLELEEQEKAFVNQAAQVNAWDKLLISNGEKILTLNQEVERVKLEQQQLEHELDYVVGQQKELQDCLVPLEKELGSLTVSDPEREYTYRLAENLDTQLKQMSEDLKEIIEHLNESNRAQDSSDPIVQIGKILNAHMNSLQWLDQRTAVLTQKIQLIDQMHQSFRQENERSLNLAYN